jgi:hypothetical protein
VHVAADQVAEDVFGVLCLGVEGAVVGEGVLLESAELLVVLSG